MYSKYFSFSVNSLSGVVFVALATPEVEENPFNEVNEDIPLEMNGPLFYSTEDYIE